MVRRTTVLGKVLRRLVMKTLNLITFILVVLGAIHTTLVGVMGVNLVGSVFGSSEVLLKLVYFLIGLSGVYMLTHFKTLTHIK